MCKIVHHLEPPLLNYTLFSHVEASQHHCEPGGSLVQNRYFRVFLMFLAALGDLSLTERDLLDGLALEGREEAETEFIGPLIRLGAKIIPKLIKPLFKSAVKGAKGAVKAAAADVVTDVVDAVQYVH